MKSYRAHIPSFLWLRVDYKNTYVHRLEKVIAVRINTEELGSNCKNNKKTVKTDI
jgi:hypothetical protein